MTARILLLLCVFSGLLRGQLAVSNLELPLFDPSGRLVRRLTAESATGSLDVLVLKSGTVEFFGPEGIEPEKIGTLTFADATYRKSVGVIESDGPMQLHFANGTLAAVGFRHELLSGRLQLRSAVMLDFPEAHVTGREGEVVLAQNKSDQDGLVSSATIRGDVAITGFKAVKEISADRLETTSATYTGNDSMLRPASPVSLWAKGRSAGKTGGEISFRIGRGSKPAAANPANGASEKNSGSSASP